MFRPVSALLLLLLALGGGAWADTGPPVAPAEAAGAELPATTAPSPAPAAPSAGTAAVAPPAETPARRAAARSDRIDRLRRNTRLALGLVGLLFLWLLTRMVGPDKDARPAHRRAVAMSHDELGRLVFQAARSRDYLAFRDLFLNAAEAARLLGRENADAYLEVRNDAVMREALDAIAARCITGTVYAGVQPVNGGLLGLRVRSDGGGDLLLQIGSVTEIEGGCRLHLPAQVVAQARASAT